MHKATSPMHTCASSEAPQTNPTLPKRQTIRERSEIQHYESSLHRAGEDCSVEARSERARNPQTKARSMPAAAESGSTETEHMPATFRSDTQPSSGPPQAA